MKTWPDGTPKSQGNAFDLSQSSPQTEEFLRSLRKSEVSSKGASEAKKVSIVLDPPSDLPWFLRRQVV